MQKHCPWCSIPDLSIRQLFWFSSLQTLTFVKYDNGPDSSSTTSSTTPVNYFINNIGTDLNLWCCFRPILRTHAGEKFVVFHPTQPFEWFAIYFTGDWSRFKHRNTNLKVWALFEGHSTIRCTLNSMLQIESQNIGPRAMTLRWVGKEIFRACRGLTYPPGQLLLWSKMTQVHYLHLQHSPSQNSSSSTLPYLPTKWRTIYATMRIQPGKMIGSPQLIKCQYAMTYYVVLSSPNTFSMHGNLTLAFETFNLSYFFFK